MAFGVIEMHKSLNLSKLELEDLFNAAINELNFKIQAIPNFINRNDIDSLEKSLHSIKGISGSYMINELYKISGDFYKYVKTNFNNVDWTTINSYYNTLENELSNASNGINNELNEISIGCE